MLTQEYTPPSLLSLSNPLFGTITHFWAGHGLVYPGLAHKLRRRVTVPARGSCGTTQRLRSTSKRLTAQIRLNAISIRDQHTTELGSMITAHHDET